MNLLKNYIVQYGFIVVEKLYELSFDSIFYEGIDGVFIFDDVGELIVVLKFYLCQEMSDVQWVLFFLLFYINSWYRFINSWYIYIIKWFGSEVCMFVLKGLFRVEIQEKVLMYLMVRGDGYGKSIVEFYGVLINFI